MSLSALVLDLPLTTWASMSILLSDMALPFSLLRLCLKIQLYGCDFFLSHLFSLTKHCPHTHQKTPSSSTFDASKSEQTNQQTKSLRSLYRTPTYLSTGVSAIFLNLPHLSWLGHCLSQPYCCCFFPFFPPLSIPY